MLALMPVSSVSRSKAPPRRLSAEDRREQILEVAARLFVERGFEAVGMADIAAELHISRPTVYSYFASTETMLEAVFEARLERFPERLSPLLQAEGPVEFSALFKALLQESDLLLLINSGGGPLFRRRRRAFLQAIEMRLQLQELPVMKVNALRRQPQLLPILLNLLTGMAYEQLSEGDAQDNDGLAQLLEVFILGGIAHTKVLDGLPGHSRTAES